MTEIPKKKGMSKGCMIGLIVGLVILVIIVALMVTCYLKKDELAKFGVTTFLSQSKTILAEEVDSELYGMVIDQFIEKFQEEESIDYQKAEKLLNLIREVPSDNIVDAAEAEQILESIYDYYPDLRQEMPEETEVDTTVVMDSM